MGSKIYSHSSITNENKLNINKQEQYSNNSTKPNTYQRKSSRKLRMNISQPISNEMIDSVSRAKSLLRQDFITPTKNRLDNTNTKNILESLDMHKSKWFDEAEGTDNMASPLSRHVPRNSAEIVRQMKEKLRMPRNPKIIKAAILGLPNSGKSTLINALMDVKVRDPCISQFNIIVHSKYLVGSY